MKAISQKLTVVCLLILALSIAIVVLYETDTLASGLLADDKQSEFILREIFALNATILNGIAIHSVLWNRYAWRDVRATTTTATLDRLHLTCYGTRITT